MSTSPQILGRMKVPIVGTPYFFIAAELTMKYPRSVYHVHAIMTDIKHDSEYFIPSIVHL